MRQPRVGDLVEFLFGLQSPRFRRARERISKLLEPGLPRFIGEFLTFGFELLGGQVIGLRPVVVVLLVAQFQPGNVSRRVEAGDHMVVGHGLVLESVLKAPGGEAQLGVDVF